MDLLSRVRLTIRQRNLFASDTRVVAAVSGGSDSVALAHLLHALDQADGCRLVSLAHFNHQLRKAADDDEAFCRRLAEELHLPIRVEQEDVKAIATRERRSVEDAARRVRHTFLERARVDLEADVIALGHTKDDQAETFLLRLLRGSGSRGLASMYPRFGHLVRPLIDCRRSELKSYLASRGLSFVHDESNDDVTIPRNRVRAELLPLLEGRFNPSVVDVLADQAELARDEHQFLEGVVDEIWEGVVKREGATWRIDGGALAELPTALGRLLTWRALTQAAGGRAVRFVDVERTLAMARVPAPAFDGPGQRVQRIGHDIVLTGRPPGAVGRPETLGGANFFEYSLSIPGEAVVAEAGCILSAEVASSYESRALSGRDGVAAVGLDKTIRQLAVRNRRPGDRFRPFGSGVRRKLQDFFVDRKVGREQRDKVPIVVDASDRIVWVAGYSINEDFRVTDSTQAVVILRLKGVGGSV